MLNGDVVGGLPGQGKAGEDGGSWDSVISWLTKQGQLATCTIILCKSMYSEVSPM